MSNLLVDGRGSKEEILSFYWQQLAHGDIPIQSSQSLRLGESIAELETVDKIFIARGDANQKIFDYDNHSSLEIKYKKIDTVYDSEYRVAWVFRSKYVYEPNISINQLEKIARFSMSNYTYDNFSDSGLIFEYSQFVVQGIQSFLGQQPSDKK